MKSHETQLRLKTFVTINSNLVSSDKHTATIITP